jgi:hypothetical protein
VQQKHTADGLDFDAQAAKSFLSVGVAQAMPIYAKGTGHARQRMANPRKGMGTGKGEIVR